VNDGDDDARALAALARRFTADSGVAPRLTLIPYNVIGDDAFRRSLRLDAFRAVVREAGVGTTVRYSGGADVAAACGQLAAR
jgi:23S rRNA (adenine2503-C2)-methyltransferase